MDWKFWNWTTPKTVIENKIENKASAISLGQSSQNPLNNSIYKAYIPEFLYRPYFGFPRGVNVLQLRKLARNPYIFPVIKTIYDSISSIKYDLEEIEGVEVPEEMTEYKTNFLKWINDPNGNPESFNHILRATIRDILELDSGIWVKVFNLKGELTQIYARDGGAFLMNPDVFGYLGGRADFIKPAAQQQQVFGTQNPTTDLIKQYEYDFNNVAAYYQYGYTNAVLPVPYGKREIVYFMQNPRTDNIYGISPIEILGDIIMTLIDGARYNLDFYTNRDVPNGLLSIQGIHDDEIMSVRARMNNKHQVEDEFGYKRNINGAIPITGLPANFVDFNIKPADLEILSQQQWFSKIVWSCFGVNANEMGITDAVNKASSEVQERINAKKALKPLLALFEYKITNELMIENINYTTDEGESITIPPLRQYYKFKFDDYDINEDLLRHQLLEQQIRMGIKTPEMVAEEEGIDISVLTKQKDEQRQKDMEMQLSSNYFNQEKPKEVSKSKDSESKSKIIEKKSEDPLKPIKQHIKEVANALKNELEFEEELEDGKTN